MVDTRIAAAALALIVIGAACAAAVAVTARVRMRPRRRHVRSVDIDAPVEQVWSWMVELGMGSADWRGRGLIRSGSTTRIAPVLGGEGATDEGVANSFEVVRIEAPWLVVATRADGAIWTIELSDRGAGRSRMASRFRPGGKADRLQIVRELRLLRRIRTCAEAGAPLPHRPVTSPAAPVSLLDDAPAQPRIDLGSLAPELSAVRGELDPAGVD